MADKKISQLTAASTLDGSEEFPIVQGGATVKTTINDTKPPIESSYGVALARATTDANVVAGQAYKINNSEENLPPNIDYILVWGLDAGAYNTNCQAYITGVGLVPCSYDIAANTLSGKYVIWAGNISQSGGADATIDYTSVNLLGETPIFDAQSSGLLVVQNTIFSFPQYKTILFSPHVFIAPNLWSPALEWSNAHELFLYMVKGDGSPADDIYNNTYIEIQIIL